MNNILHYFSKNGNMKWVEKEKYIILFFNLIIQSIHILKSNTVLFSFDSTSEILFIPHRLLMHLVTYLNTFNRVMKTTVYIKRNATFPAPKIYHNILLVQTYVFKQSIQRNIRRRFISVMFFCLVK